MIDFITAIKNVLDEQGKTTEDLFKANIISKDTFYKYKHRNPSLQTVIKLANYLKFSIDYLYERVDENNYKEYLTDQSDFYNKLMSMISSSGKSCRQFCKELNYAKDNINRYKNGVTPTIRTLYEIADYFHCNIDDLLTKI